VSKGKEAAKHPTIHKTAPTTNYLAPNANGAVVEKLNITTMQNSPVLPLPRELLLLEI